MFQNEKKMNHSITFLITIVLISICAAHKPKGKCKITYDIRSELTSTISNWYFAQIDGAKFGSSVNQFNPIIDEVFDCRCSNLDICIGSNVNNDGCSVDAYDSCNQLKDKNTGYWAERIQIPNLLITFSQMDFKCASNGNILARLTKTFYGSDLTHPNFNDDMWEFQLVKKQKKKVWRAISWNVYTVTL
eukprot:64575_1